jgi:hypothetical protein
MVWRSVRAHGDTETNKSRRTLKLPEITVEALRTQKRPKRTNARRQATCGRSRTWCSPPLWGRRSSRITSGESSERSSRQPGSGSRWVPKELRTSFVSMLSFQGVPVEEIARPARHASSRTTEVITGASCGQ